MSKAISCTVVYGGKELKVIGIFITGVSDRSNVVSVHYGDDAAFRNDKVDIHALK